MFISFPWVSVYISISFLCEYLCVLYLFPVRISLLYECLWIDIHYHHHPPTHMLSRSLSTGMTNDGTPLTFKNMLDDTEGMSACVVVVVVVINVVVLVVIVVVVVVVIVIVVVRGGGSGDGVVIAWVWVWVSLFMCSCVFVSLSICSCSC